MNAHQRGCISMTAGRARASPTQTVAGVNSHRHTRIMLAYRTQAVELGGRCTSQR